MERDHHPGSDAGIETLCLKPHATLRAIATAPSEKRWHPAAEDRFLNALASTANARLAAEAAGFSETAVYARRRKYPEFAEKWRVAREQGAARIELALIRAAEDSLEGRVFGDDRPIPRMSVEDAIRIVMLFGEDGQSKWQGRRAAHWMPHDPEKSRANILRKVAAVRRAKGYDN